MGYSPLLAFIYGTAVSRFTPRVLLRETRIRQTPFFLNSTLRGRSNNGKREPLAFPFSYLNLKLKCIFQLS